MSIETQLDRQEAERMLRVLHEHRAGEAPVEDLRSIIHPAAEMQLLIAFGADLRGRDAIVRALEAHGRDGVLRHAAVSAFEWLDERVTLAFGTARYALELGGHGQGSVYWLDEFRDGLIARSKVFSREVDARQTYENWFKQRLGRGCPGRRRSLR